MGKWNLFLSTIILLFDVLTILKDHFVLFFSIFIQIENFFLKGKTTHKLHDFLCLSDIITSSRISFFLFSIEDFFVWLEDWKLPYNLMK